MQSIITERRRKKKKRRRRKRRRRRVILVRGAITHIGVMTHDLFGPLYGAVPAEQIYGIDMPLTLAVSWPPPPLPPPRPPPLPLDGD